MFMITQKDALCAPCTMLRQIPQRDGSWCKNKESIQMLSKELSSFKCTDGTHLCIKTSILNQAPICSHAAYIH